MHLRVLSQWLADRAVIRHAARASALARVVRALLTGGKLSLTHLGRSLDGAAKEKHQIKSVDRLLGNRHLHGERDTIYAAIARTLLLGNLRPVVIVDWSDFELGRQWLMLKAAIPVGGRAISVYERVYPFKRYNSPSTHREFLRALRAVLPEGCRPIIVTDAGFRGPWFRAVEAYGWDWVGRIRNKIKYYREDTGRWCFTDSLYPSATPEPRYVGDVTLSRRHGYRFRLYLVRAHKPCGSPTSTPPEASEHDTVPAVASRAVALGHLVAARAGERTTHPADLWRAHADRGDVSRPKMPSMGFRPSIRALPQRCTGRDSAADRCARFAGRLARRSCRPSHAAPPRASSQH
jgi:hypothetical protein